METKYEISWIAVLVAALSVLSGVTTIAGMILGSWVCMAAAGVMALNALVWALMSYKEGDD